MSIVSNLRAVCLQLPVNSCRAPINMLPPESMAAKPRNKKKSKKRR